ncbi:hypothetical protein K2173_024600 [Erythroxylum novogranatense]|uniref:Auxin-responsive protein n=1 Tax=Erythroxylum novogranatense TaxID=1862640 RepID=A0AAV8SVI9_9ROSI|nr:hypothetical protein K2173_024600 [Erythroxylum novogranatense]
MESSSKNGELCPQLLDLIQKEREWLVKRDEQRSSVEKKLELRLGPPGEDWSVQGPNRNNNTNNRENDLSLRSFGYFPNGNTQGHNFSSLDKQVGGVWFDQQHLHKNMPKTPAFLQFSTTATVTQLGLPLAKESSQSCGKIVGDLQNSAEKKTFSPPSPANTAVPNSSQKRTAPGPVVGWPPIRSFRKNLASSSSSKPSLEAHNGNPNKKVAAGEKTVETCQKRLFVKINMDGVPIGRKVDLKALDSYEKLSAAVDELFRGLLAAQRDSSAGGIMNNQEDENAITGLLDGSGEYTLVYEDNEGDRMLVGDDVPWHMFISTVKRLRVLKSSEISTLSLGNGKQEKLPLK